MPEYFDSHCHLNSPDFEGDLKDVIGRMKSENIWTVVVGTAFKDSQEAVAIAEANDGIFAAVGIHPVDDPSAVFDEAEFEKLIKNTKVVAIGECGLDYFRVDPNDGGEKDRQRDLFKAQIESSLKHNLPLMIHSRSAYDELADILEAYKKTNPMLRGNMHFFTGNLEQANRFIDLDFTLSFAGPITFARDYDDVIRTVPLSSILSETDSPLVAPAPFRGKRNEPTYVKHIAEKIAEIRGEDKRIVKKAVVENTLRIFGIHQPI